MGCGPTGQGLGPRDGKVSKAISRQSLLDEMDEPLLGRSKSGISQTTQRPLFLRREASKRRVRIDGQKTAMIDKHIIGSGLRHPGTKADLAYGDVRLRIAGLMGEAAHGYCTPRSAVLCSVLSHLLAAS